MGRMKILIVLAVVLLSLSGCYTKVGYVPGLEESLSEEDIEARDTYGTYDYYYEYPYFGFFDDYQWYPYSYYGYFYDPWGYSYRYNPWWNSWDDGDYYYIPEKKPETKRRDASETVRTPKERNRTSDKEKDVKRSDRQQTEDEDESLRKHRGSE